MSGERPTEDVALSNVLIEKAAAERLNAKEQAELAKLLEDSSGERLEGDLGITSSVVRKLGSKIRWGKTTLEKIYEVREDK